MKDMKNSKGNPASMAREIRNILMDFVLFMVKGSVVVLAGYSNPGMLLAP